ncbi:collagen type IV alpha-3-binding protein [Biomphalaria pfeifferi]|uniref:Collagen type IV alpha-3-binding protein n=1 Tax=Biomphalaria pfeifferi TaxID=112525 RepID=A0AAD8BTX6_BIOPF|nr:collagen type IV alpha-3-binding protein [Biomphalaria pfeifferi]
MAEEGTLISLTDDEEDFDDEPLPELSGTLCKWTNYLHGWQDRYIVLKDSAISYYKSEDETAIGCRGAVSLLKATVTPHQFDECRFDVSVNDNVWYLRAANPEERQTWIDAIELHKQADSSYGSENNLRRHGSMLSLASGTSISQASTSSFKRGRGLKEKLAEMETFRDILCRQIDTLQSYFDSCASAVTHGAVHELTEHDDLDDDLDIPHDVHHHHRLDGLRGKDLASILQQHGGHAVDFKGEAFTFKATTAGIIATMSHCLELMVQREDAWKKRLDREVDKRKKFEEAYKALVSDKTKKVIVGGPDYEEGPHCLIPEDEFYDAVDATLDKLEKEEEKLKRNLESPSKPDQVISLAPSHPFYKEINEVVANHIRRLMTENVEEKVDWVCIADQGDMKVFKRELEENGIPIDPMKAVCTVKGITGHEVCQYFWAFDTRMEWEATLDLSRAVEWLSDDTFISNNVIKRVWPASQRDACFWSHIRHISNKNDETPDCWIVVNYSCEHPECPPNKYVRITMNVALICETIIEPPANESTITRDNITCKITYTADVNPGGWAPASVLRAVYKREYPKFLKRFTSFVIDKTKDKEILF